MKTYTDFLLAIDDVLEGNSFHPGVKIPKDDMKKAQAILDQLKDMFVKAHKQHLLNIIKEHRVTSKSPPSTKQVTAVARALHIDYEKAYRSQRKDGSVIIKLWYVMGWTVSEDKLDLLSVIFPNATIEYGKPRAQPKGWSFGVMSIYLQFN